METCLAKGVKGPARSIDQVRGALSQEADRHLCSPRRPGPAEEMLFDGGLGLGRIVARRQPDANLRARDRNQFVRGVGGGRCVNSEDGHGRAAPRTFSNTDSTAWRISSGLDLPRPVGTNSAPVAWRQPPTPIPAIFSYISLHP